MLSKILATSMNHKWRRTALIVCILVLLALFYKIYVGYFFDSSERVFNKNQCDHSVHKANVSISAPQCMQEWIKRDIGVVSARFSSLTDSNKIWGPNSQCQTRLMTIDSEKFVHHIPHFAEAFFSLFSGLIWQPLIHQYLNHEPVDLSDKTHACVQQIMIDDSSSFWSTPLESHYWMRDIVATLDSKLGIQSVQSASCVAPKARSKAVLHKVHEYSWFWHPIDAVMLTSLLLKQDPCFYYQKGPELISTPNLNVVIIGRHGTRGLFNAPEVARTLSSFQTSNKQESSSTKVGFKVIKGWKTHHNEVGKESFVESADFHSGNSAIYLEPLSLRQQAVLLRETDVVIAVHGAGETNIAFMKPCSIVIEVYPRGFYIPYYFGGLAKQSGLLHYSWNANSSHTIRKQSFIDRPFCKDLLDEMIEGKSKPKTSYFQQKKPKKDDLSGMTLEQRVQRCSGESKCRMCAREADGVFVDVDQLKEVLAHAIHDRQACIANNPYYSKI